MEKEAIKNLINSMNLTVSFVFVPWSQSRRATKQPTLSDYSLNYKATVSVNGRDILTTDYMMGQGHCPSYDFRDSQRPTLLYAERIKRECEAGRTHAGLPIMPDWVDLFYSLVSDASVLDYSTFEEWAGDLGFDSDSRKAYGIYQECLKISLALRNTIGNDNLERLKEAFQDY